MKLIDLLGLARTALQSRDINTVASAVGAINLEYTKRQRRLELAEELIQAEEAFRLHLERYRATCPAERLKYLDAAYEENDVTLFKAALPTDEDYLTCDRLELVELLAPRVAELEANPLRDPQSLAAALEVFTNQAPDIEISHGILVATGFVTETQLCFI
jgi:hypothetical protein